MSRKWRAPVVSALVLMMLLASPPLVVAQSAPQKPDDPCAAVPSVGVGPVNPKKACDAGKGAAKKVSGAAKSVGAVAKDVADKGPVGAAVGAAGDQVMAGVTAWVTETATWLAKKIVSAIDKTTDPKLDAGWFRDFYEKMVGLAALLALPMLAAVVIQAVLRQDWRLIARSVLVHVPVAFLLTGMAVLVTQQLLVATDEMSAWVSQGIGTDAREFLTDATAIFGKASAGSAGAATAAGQPGASGAVPLFALFVVGFATVIGAFTVWLELLLRAASIYVVVGFMPLFLVAMIWSRGGAIARRGIEILVALILSKFVLVTILTLAAAGLGNSRGEDAFAGALAGAALLILAAFSPWVLFRLVPLVEHGVSATRGQRAGLRSAGSSFAMPHQTVQRQAQRLWGGRSSGGGSGGGAGKGAGTGAGGGQGVAPLPVSAAATAATGALGGLQRAGGAVRDRADAQTGSASGSGGQGDGDQGSSTSSGSDSPPRPPGGGNGTLTPPPSSPGTGASPGGSAPPSPRPARPPATAPAGAPSASQAHKSAHGGRPPTARHPGAAAPRSSPPRTPPAGPGRPSGPPRPSRGL